MTRARDTANTQENIGGSVAPMVAGKNRLLNGDFSIAQRGTSFNFTSSAIYTLDRWSFSGFGNTQPVTISQQTSSPPTSTRQYIQVVATTANTANMYLSQSLETADVVKLQGKTVTVSFQYKTPTATTAGWNVAASWGTATDTAIRDVSTGTQISQGTMTTQSAWTSFTYTFTVPSTATQLSVMFITYNNVVTNATLQIANMQLEVGSVATPFTTASGSIGGELALCQRYYQRSTSTAANTRIGIALGISNTVGTIEVSFPVSMRIYPSSVDYSSLQIFDGVNTAITITSVALDGTSPNWGHLSIGAGSGITAFRPYQILAGATGYLGFSAEL